MLDVHVLSRRLQIALDVATLNQRQLAQISQVSCAQVWKVLHGHRPQVQADTLMRLASALGVSLDWLVGLVDEMRLKE